MSDTFNEKSKTIAQDFIQSILFVDDEAYRTEQGDHFFDAKRMCAESAARGFLATAYAPERQDDLKNVADIGRKADVIILDWRMNISEDSGKEPDDDEKDEAVTDFRGAFAISVIKDLINNTECGNAVDQLKLIFIYTGEPGLGDICTRLNEEFAEFDKLDDYTLSHGCIRISIWLKEGVAASFKHLPENKERIRSYTELLDEVVTEYATISSGLLSNTCLDALTSLRNNTYKLLANFSPNLDPAFVAHRAMLPNPDAAGELLKETICGELNSILTNEEISQQVSNNNIHDWVSSRDFVDTEITVKKATADASAITINIDNTKRNLWQDKGYVTLLSSEQDGDGMPILRKNEILTCERNKLKEHACKSFTPQDCSTEGGNEDFSILTHHKRNYLSTAKNPSLTIGVVINEGTRYLLCIQQKCDSVRIPDGEQRKFLFLPMKENDQNFDVLFKNESGGYTHLSICDKECHSLEIIEFAPFENSGIVQAQAEDGVYYFTAVREDQIKFKWILDLKEAHAQRIANNFAAQLSRVGLDESEWLRRA